MNDQIIPIIKEKILTGLEAPLPELTRREARVPSVSGKAMAVIGMRRAGKTSFLAPGAGGQDRGRAQGMRETSVTPPVTQIGRSH